MKQQTYFKNIELLTQEIGQVVSVIANQVLMERLIKAMAVISIPNPGQTLLVKGLAKIKSAIIENYKVDEVLDDIQPIVAVLDQLQPERDPDLSKFIKMLSECGELFQYLKESTDLNFEDILDVIDDTSLEADALISQIIRAQTYFNELFLENPKPGLSPI